MARSIGMPSRIAVGLVFMHGAFYYHAWPEVYIAEKDGRGLWLPVDPTLNQYPADATHLRLTRGGLDKQAVVLPLIGRLKMTVLDVELAPGANRADRRPRAGSAGPGFAGDGRAARAVVCVVPVLGEVGPVLLDGPETNK